MIRISVKLYVLLLCLSSSVLNGQSLPFDIADYQLPDIDRQSLDFDFSFNDNNNRTNYLDTLESMGRVGSDKDNSFSFNLTPRYTRYINTSTLQQNIDLRLNVNSLKNFDEVKDQYVIGRRSEQTDVNIGTSLGIAFTNRWYYSSNYFLGIGVNSEYSYAYSDLESYDFYTQSIEKTDEFMTNHRHSVEAQLPLSWGVGRIERVEDARHAVYLLNVLSRLGKVTNDYSHDDIRELASFISTLKSKRFFDYRIRTKYELTAIDSFLVSKDLLVDDDIQYFTNLWEYWSFGSGVVRNSGTRFSLSLQPTYIGYNSSNTNHFFSTKSTTCYDEDLLLYDCVGTDSINYCSISYSSQFNLAGKASFLYEKPINLAFQNTVEASICGGVLYSCQKTENESSISYFGMTPSNNISTMDVKSRMPYMNIGCSQTIGWYPNTRTTFSFKYYGHYVKVFDIGEASSAQGVEGQSLLLGTNLSLNYFVSPQLQFRAFWNLMAEFQDSDDSFEIDHYDSELGHYNYSSYADKKIRNFFSAGFVYSLF